MTPNLILASVALGQFLIKPGILYGHAGYAGQWPEQGFVLVGEFAFELVYELNGAQYPPPMPARRDTRWPSIM